MNKAMVSYSSGHTELKGYLCYNKDIKDKRPAIIVAHAWRGLDDFARARAEDLAKMGYIAFAADVYGIEEPAKDDEEAGKRMSPLFRDRKKLQNRIQAAYRLLSEHALVDSSRIGAIGFCFGGLTVIELLRSGCGVQAVVSFHGVLSNQLGDNIAQTVPIASNIKGSLLLLNGHEDPLFTKADITLLQDELTQANVDWTFVDYGHTTHAFTNPEANSPTTGMLYNERSARRAWSAMRQFFDDVFVI